MNAEDKLKELGLTLPPPPEPAGSYVPAVRTGNLVFVAGQLPVSEGELEFVGKVGSDLDVGHGYDAAMLCALNALSVLKAECGSLDSIVRVVRVCGFVNSAAGFTGQAGVVNGASELFQEVFGERGRHARLAIGAAELPLDAAVELEVTAEVE